MNKTTFLALWILALTVNAAEPKPTIVPVPSATVPPPEIQKEEPKVSSTEGKINVAEALCEKNKSKCIYKLKEIRATLKDSKENRKLINKIDAIIKKLK